jgi:hypothetical protein
MLQRHVSNESNLNRNTLFIATQFWGFVMRIIAPVHLRFKNWEVLPGLNVKITSHHGLKSYLMCVDTP